MKTVLTSSRVASLAAALCLAVTALPGLLLAQTLPAAEAKAASKPAVKKKVASASRVELKSQAKNMAAGIEAADAALTPEELLVAERVHVGRMPCELGATVTLTADAKTPGYFEIQGKNFKYRMFPVPTTTGTVRLEDRKAGAVWLQMGNKSMLMNQKLGTRLADECMSPAQQLVAESLKLNPAVSVLDVPRPEVLVKAAAEAATMTPPVPVPLPIPLPAAK
jgi:hypothetical protein